jgi:hypothetical protein
MDDARNDG